MRCFLVALFLFFFMYVAGQKRANVWTFGNHIGLDFNATPSPSLISSSSFELFTSSACQKDTGGLLFYADAFHIFNRYNFAIDNLYNYPVSNVIVPMPGNDSLYFLFLSNDNNNHGLKYSIVNMNAYGGFGAIEPGYRDRFIDSGEATSHCMLAAVLHANGCDTWVTVHNDSDDVFKSYLVTATGIQSPVISHAGKQFMNLNTSDGLLKFSTDGAKIVSTYNERVAGIPSLTDYGLEIFNFNNQTGMVSPNPINLSSGPVPTNYMNHLQGMSFSCDNSKFYYSNNTGHIYQLDMLAGSDTDIVQSKTLINVGHVRADNISTLQLGPDHKIYVSQRLRDCIAVINDPSNPGLSCHFKDSLIMLPLATNRCFPQFVESYFYCPPVENLSMDSAVCNGDTLTFSVDSVYNVSNYEWQFGDSTSAYGTSLNHLYGAPGNYEASLILHYNCNALIVAKKKITVADFPQINMTNDTLFCSGDTIRLIAGSDTSLQYAWSNGDSLSSVFIHTPGMYYVQVSNQGCTVGDSVAVNQMPYPSSLLPPDIIACGNDTILLTAGASPGYSYLWTTGDTTAAISIHAPGTYRVTLTDSLCVTTDSVTVYQIPYPLSFLPTDTMQCGNDSIQLIASLDTGLTYLWSTNDTTANIFMGMSGVYSVVINNAICSTHDSVIFNRVPYPVSALTPEAIQCGQDPVTLNAGQAGWSYYWSTNDTSHSITVYTPGLYTVNIASGICTTSDTVMVSQVPFPVVTMPADTLMCRNGPLLLIADTSTRFIYLWSTGDTTSSIYVTMPGIYSVIVQESLCSSTGSLTVNQEPGLELSKIPNVFTPNGDNLNDEFVMAANENILHLTIFDRWGQKVFESSEQVKTWNGKKDSTVLNEGTYYYVAELMDCSNQVVSVKGTVYLKK